MIPVILSGGSGTRLWPLSRSMFPKQFLPLTSERSMFQETLLRVSKVTKKAPIVIANNDHRFVVAENIRDLPYNKAKIVLEEKGRNTAPAIAVASLIAYEQDPEAILFVLPADHTIQNIDAFYNACLKAEVCAREGYLTTFGITPEMPNVNYGYIKVGTKIADSSFYIDSFKEKPDEQTAKQYIDDGCYLWNSGMFMFKASLYLEELKKYNPNILLYAKKSLDNSQEDMDFIRLSPSDFVKCPDVSVDYAVMEKTEKGVVVELDASWCDVGSWDSLWSVLDQDSNGNVCYGDVMISDSANSYIYSEHKLVSVLGIENLIIADTKDALLVSHKNNVKDVKNIVDKLKLRDRPEGKHHRTVYRPWGHYDTIDVGLRDIVKRITVLPGRKISMQKHEYRAEHWIMVKGTANIVKEGQHILLNENESIFIPKGIAHSLENKSSDSIELIEVQTGDHLSENDILRLENFYNE